MELRELELLLLLAEEKNISKAAARAFISQPALTQRLQALEKAWGTTLFLRSNKGLTLTPEGEKVIAFAQETTGRQQQVIEELQGLTAEIHGTLHLAVGTILAQYWLPGRLSEFVKRYPLVHVDLQTGWSSHMMRKMYDDESHVAIVRGNPEWSGWKQHLFSDPLLLVDTTIQSLAELEHVKKPFLQVDTDSTYRYTIEQWWYHQFKRQPPRSILVDQFETCKQLVLHGIGYAILPGTSITERETALKKLPICDPQGQPIYRDTWLIVSEPARQLPQVQAFIQLLTGGDPSPTEEA